MRWKTWVPLVVSIVAGLAAFQVGRGLLLRKPVIAGLSGRTVSVLVAARDLGPGSAIGANDIKESRFASDQVPAAACSDAATIQGRVLTIPAFRGQLLLRSMLAPEDSGLGLQALVPPGMRAVAVEVSESGGLAGLLMPGAHVDVLATVRDARTDTTLTRTIVQNVKVKAIGRQLMAAEPKESDRPNHTLIVTLLVTPKQAEAIELATAQGRPRLALRNGRDTEAGSGEGLALADLLSAARAAPQWMSLLASAAPSPRPTEADARAPMLASATVGPASPVTRSPARPWVVHLIRGGVESDVRLAPDTIAGNGRTEAADATDVTSKRIDQAN